jgi:cyclophilin family peptidyl-prolyl cis-trans isomerase
VPVRLLILLVALLLGAAACGGDDDEGGEATPPTTTAEQTTTEETTTEETTTAETAEDAGCVRVDQPEPKPEGTGSAPEQILDATKTYRLVVDTSCGQFTIELDLESAPQTTASLVALARAGFYDGTTFHRVVPGFVIQGGDPTGTGSGGPGYTTVDTPPAGTTYISGVVAMAKTPAEPAGTSGSQFFVVTGGDIGLPPDYAVVGRVVEGMETVGLIDALGAGDGPPSQPVVIEKVTVEES